MVPPTSTTLDLGEGKVCPYEVAQCHKTLHYNTLRSVYVYLHCTDDKTPKIETSGDTIVFFEYVSWSQVAT